ncbi:MAG: uridine kinase [Gammaproteobacteria bacterium]|nr:uridine kinase [Gammaproteobacteria bacterium]
MISESYIIGICGGTCSGKTTLAKNLHQKLNGLSVYISQDSYYKDQSHKTSDEIKKHNFDHPDSLDLDLLYQHVKSLKSNRQIEMPNYCFKTHSRLEDAKVVRPANVVIVEGILTFSHRDLRELFDLRVFVDIEADVRLARRIRRDSLERSRSIDSIIDQYLMTVKPMHDQFVEKNKQYSDLIIDAVTFSRQQNDLEDLLLSKYARL